MSNIIYDDSFYDANESGSYRSARVALELAMPILRPASVLDVGCGVGTWLRAAEELGASEVRGVDGDYVDRRRLHIDPSLFFPADLNDPDAVETAIGTRRFDLTLCLETAEHLPTSASRELIANLARSSNVVLWSAALPGQGGTHHVNERPLTYWASLWSEIRYCAVDVLRPGLQFTSVDVWYAQNAVLFVKENDASRIEDDFKKYYENKFGFVPPLSFVHPTVAAPLRALSQSKYAERLEYFAGTFHQELALELERHSSEIERYNVVWDGHLAWVGFKPQGSGGIDPSLLLISADKVSVLVGLYFPAWQASENESLTARRKAETQGLIWNDPVAFKLEGWTSLSLPRLSTLLSISLLNFELSAISAAAADAAQLWRTYFGTV